MTELEKETVPVARNIETVTAEIVAIRDNARRVVLASAIEIGRRLVEAKDLLPHGGWGGWLKDRVDYSQDTAERLIRLYEGYGAAQGSLFGAELDSNSATLRNLSISSALQLLAVPEDERESFAEAVDADKLSTRQLEDAIKEKEAAERRAAEAEKIAEDRKSKLLTAEEDRKRAEDRVKELESHPIEVAVQEPDPDAVKKAVDEALANAQKGFNLKQKVLQDKLEAAEKKRDVFKAEAEKEKSVRTEAERKGAQQEEAAAGVTNIEKKRLEREIEALKKQLAMSDAAVASFRTLFDQSQNILNRLLTAMAAIQDAETKEKLRAAVKKLLESFSEEANGT
jgi:Protein of unknown function (DUF3102).